MNNNCKYNYNNFRQPNYNFKNNNSYSSGDRIFWAPFLVGGLAGTALGYGIANNNYGRYYPYPPMYYYPAPMPYNNFYF